MSKFRQSLPSASLMLEIFLSLTFGTITILPVIISMYIVNQFCRFFLSTLLWFLYDDEIALINTGYDGMYMYKGHVNGKRMVLYVATMEDLIDISSHKKSYENHILNQPAYQKLKNIWMKKFGYHCLKKDYKFSINNHIRSYDGLEGSDKIVTEDELMDEILPELSKDMDDSKPQWEDVIVPRFRYNNSNEVKCVRIFRVHHGYGDGISNLLMLAYSQSEGRDFPWVIDPLTPSKRSIFSEMAFQLFSATTFSSTIFKNIYNKPSAMKNRWHVRNFTGETLHGWSKPIEMETFRKIRKSTKMSMPTIICSILASAVRRFEQHYESEDPEFRGKLSEEIIIGLVAAMLPYPDLELRNQHCILKCHLDCRDLSRVERLFEINKEIQRLSNSPEIYMNYWLPRLYGVMPGRFSDACTSLIGGCGCVSNFPAASRKVKLWGNEVIEMFGYVPMLTPAGFACVTLRYGDHLRFCLNADKAALTKEQLKYFAQVIADEADLLARESEYAAEFNKNLINKSRPVEIAENIEKSTENNNNIYEESSLKDTRLNSVLDKIFSSVKKIKHS